MISSRSTIEAGLLVAATLSFSAVAQHPSSPQAGILVRMAVDPSSEIVIGQQVQLSVDVLFPDEMPFPPRIALPAVEGAQMLRFETQALTVHERIAGTDYIGKRFEIALYPRRGGELTIPSMAITLLDKSENKIGATESPPAHLYVAVPPGVDASRPVIASSLVTMTETWSPAPNSGFRVGQALQRTITRSAENVLGLAFGDLDFGASSTVHIYLDQPQIDDEIDRGRVTGHRVDRATYAFEGPGSYTIPVLTQQWWDTAERRVKVIQLPQRAISVAAERTATARGGTWLGAVTQPTFWGPLLGIIAGLAVIWRLRPQLQHRWTLRRARRVTSESAAFHTLKRAAATGSAAETYRAFIAWRRHIDLRDITALVCWQNRLDRALFGMPTAASGWSGEDGRALVSAAASLRRRAKRRTRRQPRALLPPLTPSD